MSNATLTLAVLLAVAMSVAVPAVVHAQAYPSRPIHLVVGVAPGSIQDVAARVVSRSAGQLLGAQVVVENKPRAATMIASESVAKARANGYTLLQNGVALSVNPGLYKRVPYDAARDFAPVAFLVTAPQILVVHPSLEVRTLAEFLAKYRGTDILAYASPGAGTMPHLAAELLKAKTGLKMRNVPYKGGALALNDVIAGHVNLTFVTPVAKPQIDAGKVRALAAAAHGRVETLPDVPTFAEAGLPIPEISAGAWFGIFAPAGTTAEVIARLNQAFNAALADSGVKEELKRVGLVPNPMSPQEFAAFVREDMSRWPAIIAAAGLRADE